MTRHTTKIDFSPLRLTGRQQRWAWLAGSLRANTPDALLKAMVVVLGCVVVMAGVVVGLTLGFGALLKTLNASQLLFAPLVAGTLYLLFRLAGGGDKPRDTVGAFMAANGWQPLVGSTQWVPQFAALEHARTKTALLRSLGRGLLAGRDFTFYHVDVAGGLVGTPLQHILPFRVLAIRAEQQLPSVVIDDRRTKGRFLGSFPALKLSESQRWLEDELYEQYDFFFQEADRAVAEKLLSPKVLRLLRDHVKGDVILEDNYLYVLQPADFTFDEKQARELFKNAGELAKALRL